MAKARGHRANKPNDSFGTINNTGLYRGSYRDDVYKDEDDEQVEAQEADPSEEATPEEQGFSDKKSEDVDYKKRYDDLKRHYDAKLSEWKDEKAELAAQGESSPELDALTRLKAPKSLEELEQFKQDYPDVQLFSAIVKGKTHLMYGQRCERIAIAWPIDSDLGNVVILFEEDFLKIEALYSFPFTMIHSGVN